ncbi:MAG: glucoamylase family protein [Bacillota bacterium]|jgi:hypothetical protein|nr:glucoamylase family protein [Bacillota bacterium]MDI9415459.1 glucoamylase family protein [Bacillota bacterium]NLD12811.1 hypothetical protein [Bacillota bacterium]HCD41405.1 hypothetical protein [Bacillota bacterium]HOJ58382.1 glucoamylase family protein [Bacillota bacterium]
MYPASGGRLLRRLWRSSALAFIITILASFTVSAATGFEDTTLTEATSLSQILLMDDEELLSTISKKSFDYFWHEANPENGFIPHSDSEDSPCSIKAVGLGLSAIPVGIERKWISREEGYERCLTTLISLSSGKVPKINGFFYQFIDMNKGARFGKSKVSSMDTAILLAGALFAGEYFSGTRVHSLANELYSAVNWQWMMNGGETLSGFWSPESGFHKGRRDSFDESMLMYILAMGSPTYQVPASTWHRIRRPVRENYIFTPEENLASYILPHLWLDLRGIEDYYANYWNNVVVAARYNRIYSMLKSCEFGIPGTGIWGLAACDGPGGYRVYGASAGYYHEVFAPYVPLACIPFSPDPSMAAVREMLRRYGSRIWGTYGFTSGFTADGKWWSKNHHAVSAGLVLLMIENYRTSLVWKHTSSNEYIKEGLKCAGFSESLLTQAVTPAYLEDVRSGYRLQDYPANE